MDFRCFCAAAVFLWLLWDYVSSMYARGCNCNQGESRRGSERERERVRGRCVFCQMWSFLCAVERVVGGGGAMRPACWAIFWPCPRTDLCALMDVSQGRRRGRGRGKCKRRVQRKNQRGQKNLCIFIDMQSAAVAVGRVEKGGEVAGKKQGKMWRGERGKGEGGAALSGPLKMKKRLSLCGGVSVSAADGEREWVSVCQCVTVCACACVWVTVCCVGCDMFGVLSNCIICTFSSLPSAVKFTTRHTSIYCLTIVPNPLLQQCRVRNGFVSWPVPGLSPLPHIPFPLAWPGLHWRLHSPELWLAQPIEWIRVAPSHSALLCSYSLSSLLPLCPALHAFHQQISITNFGQASLSLSSSLSIRLVAIWRRIRVKNNVFNIDTTWKMWKQ